MSTENSPQRPRRVGVTLQEWLKIQEKKSQKQPDFSWLIGACPGMATRGM